MKTSEVKAEPMTTTQLDRWLAGKIPRRILVAPFGGPVASPVYAKGVDVDGEYFHEGTDFYGPYSALRASRDRLVDFHHATFAERESHPAIDAVKGAIMGRVVLDEDAEEVDGFAGLWGDFWANAGEKRRQLIAWLESHGHGLYGSSQAVPSGVRKSGGRIDVWPIQYHTITTSPQNTLAIVPSLKASLQSETTEVTIGALRALAVDLDNLADLTTTSGDGPGDEWAKGRVTLLDPITTALERLREVVPTHPDSEVSK